MPTELSTEVAPPEPVVISDHHVPGQEPGLTALLFLAGKLGPGAVEEVRRILAGGPEIDESNEDYVARVVAARERAAAKSSRSSRSSQPSAEADTPS